MGGRAPPVQYHPLLRQRVKLLEQVRGQCQHPQWVHHRGPLNPHPAK